MGEWLYSKPNILHCWWPVFHNVFVNDAFHFVCRYWSCYTESVYFQIRCSNPVSAIYDMI